MMYILQGINRSPSTHIVIGVTRLRVSTTGLIVRRPFKYIGGIKIETVIMFRLRY